MFAAGVAGLGEAVDALVLDMLAKPRRVIIAAQYRRTDPQPPTLAEINLLRLAWEDAAA